MGPIEKELIEVLNGETEKLPNISRVEKYEEMWNDLVKRGIAKERGYNLLTIDSPHHLDRVNINESSLPSDEEWWVIPNR